MSIMLNEEQLATGIMNATWSPTASEVSGTDCTGDIDAEICTEIGGEIVGTSSRATVASSV